VAEYKCQGYLELSKKEQNLMPNATDFFIFWIPKTITFKGSYGLQCIMQQEEQK